MSINVGFLGAGYIAGRHVQALSGLTEVVIRGVADTSAERAEALARQSGAVPCGSIDELLDLDLDAVYLCVPPFAHGEPERRVLERGLPMFVEKPLSLDVATARAIGEAARRAGVVTAVGYHWRYLDSVKGAHAALVGRAPRMVLGHWLTATPGAPWWTRQSQSGGQMLEQATHLVDLARCLAGEVADVGAWGSTAARAAFPDSDVADASIAVLAFESGALGVIAATCLLDASHRIGLQVIAEGVSVEILARGPGGTAPFELLVDRGGGVQVEVDRSDPFVVQSRAFLDAVQGKENRVLVPYEEALKTHQVACAAANAIAAAGLEIS